MNTDVADILTRARTQLILDHCFFGQLALRLPLKEDFSIPTAAVDGKRIYYNPTFIASLPTPQVKTLLAHEVMHCVFDHISREGDRIHRKWNQAGDYVINLCLAESKFEPIKNWLYDTRFKGKTADEVYNLLPDTDNEPLDDCRSGTLDDREITATDWKIATIQAANAARQEGELPDSLARFVEELTQPKIDWRAVLRRFVTEINKDDYSWARFNRRFISQDIFLPTLYSETMGEIVVAIDTSGSIDQATLNAFGGEVKAIVQSVRPTKTYVIYCDTKVNHVDEFGPNDDLVFEMHGGGGTSFHPPFNFVARQSLTPSCLVYLTDLYGPFPAAPEYPVLWVATSTDVAPFGETVHIKV